MKNQELWRRRDTLNDSSTFHVYEALNHLQITDFYNDRWEQSNIVWSSLLQYNYPFVYCYIAFACIRIILSIG